MKFTSKLQILASALVASAIVSTPASAGLLGDIIGIIFGGGGGGGGGGGNAAPEIDASAGIAAMALVACVAAIAHRRNRR